MLISQVLIDKLGKMEEAKPLTNKEEGKEKDENSLLNCECDEDDDGVDWET